MPADEPPIRESAFRRAPTRPVPSRPELVMTPFLADSDMAVSLADPSRPDQPLVHVNDAFCRLTGYAREECLGRNCRFLQGPLTIREEVAAIRRGVETDTFLLTRLLNYRRDGRLFDNALQLGQLRDAEGRTRFLFGLQWDITETLRRLDASAEHDLADRTLSPRLRTLGRLARHVVRRSNELGEGAAGVPLVERLVALSRPYQFPPPDPRPERAALHALLAYLLDPYGYAPGRGVRFDGAPGVLAAELVGALALWVHETARAARYAEAGDGGEVVTTLSWGFPTVGGRPMVAFNWNRSVVDGAPGVSRFRPFLAPNRTGGHGARIMREAVEFVGGRAVTQAWDASVDATLLLPNEAEPTSGPRSSRR